MSGDFAVDELDRIYAGGSDGGYMTRLDGTTFSIQAWTISGFFAQPEQIRVRRNPSYPYLWVTDNTVYYATISLLNRETMVNPLDSTSPQYIFLCPDTAIWLMGIDIDNSDGGLWALYFNNYPYGGLAILGKLRPDGTVQDWDICSQLTGITSAYNVFDQISYDNNTNQIIIGAARYSNGEGKIWVINCDTMTFAGVANVSGWYDDLSARQGFKRGVVGGYLYFLNTNGQVIKFNVVNYSYEIMADISSELPVRRDF